MVNNQKTKMSTTKYQDVDGWKPRCQRPKTEVSWTKNQDSAKQKLSLQKVKYQRPKNQDVNDQKPRCWRLKAKLKTFEDQKNYD